MSFFDSLFSGLTGGTAGLISGGLNLVGSALAANRSAEATDQAAQIGAATSAAQLEELKRAKAAGLGYIDQGAAKYADTVAPLLTERPILQPTYRGMTAQQELGRQDLIRQGGAQLAASGLRGAGRAGVGAVLDSVGRYDATVRSGNDAADLAGKAVARAGADQARAGLAGVQVNTGTQKANTELGVGSQSANVLGNQGNAAANLAERAGDTAARLYSAAGRTAGNTVMWGAGDAAGRVYGNSPNQPILAPGYGYSPKLDDDNQPKV